MRTCSTFDELARGRHRLEVETVAVAAVEAVRVLGMDRQRRPTGAQQWRVVEDVVDVAVRVSDEVQTQAVRRGALHEGLRGPHARVDHQRVG